MVLFLLDVSFLSVGDRFASFEDFRNALQEYSLKVQHQFVILRITSTGKLRVVCQKNVKNLSENVFEINCPGGLEVNKKLQIISMNEKHNHPLGKISKDKAALTKKIKKTNPGKRVSETNLLSHAGMNNEIPVLNLEQPSSSNLAHFEGQQDDVSIQSDDPFETSKKKNGKMFKNHYLII